MIVIPAARLRLLWVDFIKEPATFFLSACRLSRPLLLLRGGDKSCLLSSLVLVHKSETIHLMIWYGRIAIQHTCGFLCSVCPRWRPSTFRSPEWWRFSKLCFSWSPQSVCVYLCLYICAASVFFLCSFCFFSLTDGAIFDRPGNPWTVVCHGALGSCVWSVSPRWPQRHQKAVDITCLNWPRKQLKKHMDVSVGKTSWIRELQLVSLEQEILLRSFKTSTGFDKLILHIVC